MQKNVCATRDCDKSASWYTIAEGNKLGSSAPRRCTVCCNAIGEALENLEYSREKNES